MPPRVKKSFTYNDPLYVRNNSGANYLVYAFRCNDLYDPDPLLLSGSLSGFKEMMAFYNYYRVLNSHIVLHVTNNESFPVLVGIVYSTNSLVGVIGSRDDAINALENDFSTRPILLAAKGGIDNETISVSLRPWLLLGNKAQYLAEAGYTGTVVTSPSIPLYAHVIIASPNTTNLSNGVTTALNLGFDAEFFSRTNLRA
jgi:hypothetical protein